MLAVSFPHTISGLSAGVLRLSRPIQLILKFLFASLAATFESPDNVLRRDFLRAPLCTWTPAMRMFRWVFLEDLLALLASHTGHGDEAHLDCRVSFL